MKGERMGSNGRPEGKADGEIRKMVSALWKRRNFQKRAPFGYLLEFHLKRPTGTDMQDILPARLSLSAHLTLRRTFALHAQDKHNMR